MSRFVSSAAVIIDSLALRTRTLRTGPACRLLAFACLVLLPAGLFPQTLTTTVSTGAASGPYAIAVNPVTNTIFAANNTTGTVTVINGETNAVQATVTVGTLPTAIAVNPSNNMVYVVNNGTGGAGTTLSYFLGSVTGTPTASTVTVGTGPIAVAVDEGNGQVYVANNGTTGTAGSTVSVYSSASTPVLLKTVTVQNRPYAIAVNPITHDVFVGTNGANFSVDWFSGTTLPSSGTAIAMNGKSPQSLAIDPVKNLVYAASNTIIGGVYTVSLINGATHTVSGSPLTVGTAPIAVAVNPVTGTAYVLNQTAGTVNPITGCPSTCSVGTAIAVGTTPQALAINPVTNYIYVANSGGRNISAINGATNTPTTVQLATGTTPYGVAVNPATNKVYVADFGKNTVSVVDGATNGTANTTTGSTPLAVAVNSATNTIFSADSVGDDVTVINGATGGVLATVPVGNGPNALAVDPVVNQVFVTNGTDGTMTVIDAVTGEGYPTTTVTTGTDPVAVAVDPVLNIVYTANNGSHNITAYDEATGTKNNVGVGVTSATPAGIAVNPVTHNIYVSDSTNGTVKVFSGSVFPPTLTTSINVGALAAAIAVDPVTNFIYVGCKSSVYVINGATNSAAALAIGVSYNPYYAVAVNTVTNTVYTANQGNNSVSVIAGATASVAASLTTTVTVGTTPVSVAVNPATNVVYAADQGSNDLYWIDGATNKAVNIVPAGVTAPTAVAVNPETNVAYVANMSSANVTAITPNAISSIPLAVTALSLTSTGTVPNLAILATTNASPAFSATVASSSPYSTATIPVVPTDLYYQLDTAQGAWASATDTSGAGANPATFTFSLSSVPVGVHILYAYPTYGGEGAPESNGVGSGNSPEIGNMAAYPFVVFSQTVSSTSIALTTGSSPAVYGTSLTFTATVTPSSGPTGSVIFYNGSSPITGCTTVALASGTAACTTTALPVGTGYITAVYSGDNTYTWSESTPLSQTITVATPTVAITPSPVSIAYGSATGVSVTATFTGAGAADAAPSGVVTFTASTGAAAGTFSFTQSSDCTATTDVLTCVATYTPTGAASAATYTSAFSASIAAAGNYAASGTANADLVVTAATPTSAITPSPVPSVYGSTSAITVTATFGGTGVSGDGAPSGTVTFTANTGTLGGSFSFTQATNCVAGGTNNTSLICTAMYTPSGTLSVASSPYSNAFTASIAAGGNYGASLVANANLTVSRATPTMGISNVNIPYGSTTGVTVTGTATGVGAGAAPTGVMSLVLGAGIDGTIGACTATTAGNVKSCAGTYTPSGVLAVGSYTTNTIDSHINVAGNYNAATSGFDTVTVSAATPTPTIATVVSPYGSVTPVSVVATFAGTGVSGGTAPSGTVSFTANTGTVGGSFSFNQGSNCVTGGTNNTSLICTATYTPSGTLPFIASPYYTGAFTASITAAGNYGAAGPVNGTLHITRVAPTVLVTDVSTTYGSTTGVTVTATITGAGTAGDTAPGGAVTFGFTTGGTSIGGTVGSASCNSSGNVTTCTATYTPSGTQVVGTYAPPSYNTIMASIALNGNYTAATSAGDTVTIGPATPTASISPIPVSTAYGSTTSIPVVATFAGTGVNGDTAPNGTVTFSTSGIDGTFSFVQGTNCVAGGTNNTSLICTATYTPSGALAAGTYTNAFTAGILANGNYNGAGPVSDNLVVGDAGTTVTVASSANPSMYGQSVTFTATITSATGAIRRRVLTPSVTGSMTWSANTGCSATPVFVVSAGTSMSTCTTSLLPVGTAEVITATYLGDSNHSGGSGTLAGGQTVNTANTATSVASTPNPSIYGQSVTFTATVLSGFESGIISTYAGNGTQGYGGNGGPATGASFNTPADVVMDVSGNQYIADSSNCIVWQVNPATGNISIFAGTAQTCGYTGDAGAATLAQLNAPGGLAVDSAGDLFIADSSNNVIRMVSAATGYITTVAGSGTAGYTGDGGSATLATLHAPGAIGLDSSGNIYIADTSNCAVREVSGGSIATIAGGNGCGFGGDTGPATSAMLNRPDGIGLDSSGNVYIADTSNNAVREVSGGNINTVAGNETCAGSVGDGGPATQATVCFPQGVTVSASGDLYIADTQHCAVRAVHAGIINSVAGLNGCSYGGDGGPATSADLNFPNRVAFDSSGNYYIADTSNQRVRKVNTAALASPTGTVSWTGSTGCAASTLTNNTATCTTSVLPVGNPDLVTGTYSGDGNYSTSNGSVNQVVNTATSATSTTLTSGTNPSTYGGSVMFTATITGQYGLVKKAKPGIHSEDVTGTVTWSGWATAGTDCPTANVIVGMGSSTATCTTAILPSGSDTITATYSGDSNHSGSSGSVMQTVSPFTPAISLGNMSTTYGGSASSTITVTGVAGGSNLTGAVTCAVGSALTGSCAVTGCTSGSSITCTATWTPVSPVPGDGTYNSNTITATIAAGGDYATNTSAANQVVIGSASTTTGVITSGSPSTYGNSVTFTATVTGANGQIKRGPHSLDFAGGSVNFTDSATGMSIPGCSAVSVSGTSPATAGCTYSLLAAGSHTITATFSGDSNHGGSSGTVSQTVNAAGTTTVLTTSPNPSSGGQTVTFTATVSPAPTFGSGLGSVTFTANGTTIGVIGLLTSYNGVATLYYAGLAPSGSAYSIVATYTPPMGGSLSSSTSNTVMQTVNEQSTTTSLNVSNLSPTYGQSITLTATVTNTGYPGNSGTPAGTVTFRNGATLLGNVSLVAGANGTATATLVTAALPVGSASVTASYPGSNVMQGSSSSATTVTVSQATSTTALTSMPNPSLYGQTITFTATVAPQYAGVPTGTVTFYSGLGATKLGVITLDGSGVATLNYSTLNVGDSQITAVYSGSANFATSTSAAVVQVVSQVGTTTALVSNAMPPVVYGQPVMFTATVTQSSGMETPVGSVQFKNGSTLLGAATLSGGVATLTTSALPVATDNVTANYLGTGLFANSTSNAVAVSVGQASSTTALAASPVSPPGSTGAQTVTFTATVSPQYGGSVTGTVTFKNGATSIGTVAANTSGVAMLNYAALLPGTHSITATYNGSTNVGGSASTATSYIVTIDSTTTVLTTNPNPSTHGNSVTLTATVTPGNGVAATGTVGFYNGATLMGNATLSGGVATLHHTFNNTGSFTLKAVYNGSSYKSGSTSANVTQVVQ